MLRSIVLAFVVMALFLAQESLAQTATGTTSAPDYLQMVVDESKAQRKFLHEMYTHFQWIIGTVGGLIFLLLLGVVTYFNFRTKKDMVDSISLRVSNEASINIEREIRGLMEKFEQQFTRDVEVYSQKFTEEVQRVTAELTESSESAREDSDRDADAIIELRERLAGLQKAVAELQAGKTVSEASRIKVAQDETNQSQRDKIWQRVEYALLHHKFVWRSLERLALAAGTTPEVVEEILDQHRDDVKLSVGKSGRRIARHLTRQSK